MQHWRWCPTLCYRQPVLCSRRDGAFWIYCPFIIWVQMLLSIIIRHFFNHILSCCAKLPSSFQFYDLSLLAFPSRCDSETVDCSVVGTCRTPKSTGLGRDGMGQARKISVLSAGTFLPVLLECPAAKGTPALPSNDIYFCVVLK